MDEKYLTKAQLEWLSNMTVTYEIDNTDVVIRIKLGTKSVAENGLRQLIDRTKEEVE